MKVIMRIIKIMLNLYKAQVEAEEKAERDRKNNERVEQYTKNDAYKADYRKRNTDVPKVIKARLLDKTIVTTIPIETKFETHYYDKGYNGDIYMSHISAEQQAQELVKAITDAGQFPCNDESIVFTHQIKRIWIEDVK